MSRAVINRRQSCEAGICVAVALALLTGLPARLQGQGVGATLRVTTRLVNVNVVVTDSQGNPVRSLNQDDFTILDEGQHQRIVFFSVIDNERSPTTASLLAPDTYTNRPANYADLSSATILLFDTLNSRWTSQGFGLHRVRKLLRQIEPQDHLGIYVLGDGLKVVHSFSRDASDLVEAIGRYDEGHSRSSEKSTANNEESTGDTALKGFLSGRDNAYRFELDGMDTSSAFRTAKFAIAREMTTSAIEEIARQLADIQGRKELIWVTDNIGAMVDFESNNLDELLERWSDQSGIKLAKVPAWEDDADVERMIRLMNSAGIAVYTVDARGLETVDLGFRDTGGGTSSNTDAVNDLIGRTPGPSVVLLELARRTGGRAFFNRNDLETGIRRAEDDTRFTYSLAYAPDHERWKGEWRKIQVRVNRPGLTVLARGGYFALPDPRPVSPKNLLGFFSQIAASPIESTQLPLSVHLGASRGSQGAQIDAKVHFDPLPMLTHQNDGYWVGGFEIMFMQIGDKNKLVDATKKEVDAHLDPQKYAMVSKTGWDVPAELKFMPGAKLLCVILHDRSTDAVGSVRIPLEHYSALLLTPH